MFTADWAGRVVIGLFLGVLAPGAWGEGPYTGQKVARVELRSVRDVLALSALGVDLWTHSIVVGEPAEARVNAEQLAALAALGIKTEIIEADLQARVDAGYAAVAALNGNDNTTFYENYRTEAEIRARLEGLAAADPAFASSFVMGTSLESRPMWAVRLGAPDRLGNPRSARPVVFFNATQHAREWVAPMAATYFAEQLLSTRTTSATARDLLNRLEIVVMPVSNPDGYAYTWAGQRMWRKNKYRDGVGTLYGVDLNRNWGFQWGGVGASTNPNDQTYRGPSAFSEPEARVLRDFVVANPRLSAHVDIHTYGNLVLSPWCYTNTPPPDAAFFVSTGATIRSAVLAVNGLSFTVGQWYSALYPSSGTAVDFVYGQQGAKSWTFELRGGRFDPPADQILPGCTETFAGLVEVAKTALRPVCAADANLDGVVDFNDILEWIGVYNAGETGGRSVLSRASIRNRLGYAGYQHDPSITGSGQGSGQSKYHVRHRVCDASVGRWTRRDPLGYVSGPTVYQYVNSEPLIGADPSGLMRVRCGGGLEYCREPEPLPAFVEPLFPLVVPRAIAPATGVWVCTPLGATVVCCATVGVLVYCVTDKELREASKIKECERLHAEYEESCKAAGAGGNSKAAECNEFDDCLTLCLKWARNDDCVKKREEHRDKGCWDLRAPPREPHRGRWIEQHKNSIRRYSDNRKNCAELIRNYHRRRGGPPCDCGFPVHD